MIKAGIIGGAGYTAGELLRILVNHPEVEIVSVQSASNSGNRICDVHQGLYGDTDLLFSEDFDLNAVDVLFLCSGHGKSEAFWKENARPDGLKVIDLAQDYRDEHDGYVYGLPEWQKSRIAAASKVANPGCFATGIQLALLPLAAAGELSGDVNVTAITGSTGAGVKPGATTHFSWRNNNISTYKVFEHQHLLEINRNLSLIQSSGCLGEAGERLSCSERLAALGSSGRGPQSGRAWSGGIGDAGSGRLAALGSSGRGPQSGRARSDSTGDADSGVPASWTIDFVPMRGDFARGIFVSAVLDCCMQEEDAVKLYETYYKDAAFTFVSPRPVDLKDVVNTNKALVHVEKHGDKLVVSSVIDNLLKGASGQAVQNMNIMFGLPEKLGLRLKASAF